MIYLFVGPPTSGKGTQAKLLAEALHLAHYSIGALLRTQAESDPVLMQSISHGELISDTYVKGILEQCAPKHSGESVVIDGIPRSVDQVSLMLKIFDFEPIKIFLLELDDDQIIQRATKRVEEGHKRDDDAVTVVHARISHYRSTISSILNALADHSVPVIRIDGNQSIDLIHQSIMSSL